MKASEELARLVAQERAATPPMGSMDRGWSALESAIAAGTPPLALAPPLKVASSLALFKGALVPFVFGALVGGGVMAARHAALRPQVPTRVEVSMPASGASPVPAARAPEPDPAFVAPAPAVSTAAPSLGASNEMPPESSSLEEELSLVKRAKAALDAGRTEEARSLLDEHQRAFPGGVLATERDGLRIVLTCRSGDLAAGRAAARRFLQRGSILSDHIQRVCRLDEEFDSEPMKDK